MEEDIIKYLEESIDLKRKIIENADKIQEITRKIIGAYREGKKVLIAGNGGSAADAQHFAAELVGRYKLERKGLPAIALTTNTSNLTAIGNDYGFEDIFTRQIDALGKKGDIFIGISTSGNSQNLIKAIEKAREKGMFSISLLGRSGGKMKEISDLSLIIPSENTPRIQEAHITLIHIICELLEKELFKNGF